MLHEAGSARSPWTVGCATTPAVFTEAEAAELVTRRLCLQPEREPEVAAALAEGPEGARPPSGHDFVGRLGGRPGGTSVGWPGAGLQRLPRLQRVQRL